MYFFLIIQMKNEIEKNEKMKKKWLGKNVLFVNGCLLILCAIYKN